jgi:small subunit ribosomal protein S21
MKDNKITGNTVFLREGEYIDSALRKFKKKVQDSGLLQELRDREFYEKPTTERKRKKSAAKNRWQKELAKQELPKKMF